MCSTLPVVETFHSLQGEGAHVGRSAFFIRLASCNVQCPWCDTKNSWDESKHPQKTLIELAQSSAKAQLEGSDFVVITGGEPLHHNLTPLCAEIRKQTFNKGGKIIPIHLETSGVNPLTGEPDWITLSPKRHAHPEKELLALCNELKIIIHEVEDLKFAEDMARRSQENSSSNARPLLFLQAGWNNTNAERIAIEYVKSNPQWRLSMQTHKWLGVL